MILYTLNHAYMSKGQYPFLEFIPGFQFTVNNTFNEETASFYIVSILHHSFFIEFFISEFLKVYINGFSMGLTTV